MKKLIAVAALGAMLSLSLIPAVVAGEQEGPVFEPQPVPPSIQPLGQGTYTTPSEDTQPPLNPDIRG